MASIPELEGGFRNAGRRWLGDTILRRMVGNTLVLLGGKAVNGALSLGTMALAVRSLGIEGYGVLVLIHTFAVAVANIGKFQSWQAVLRYGAPALQHGMLEDFARLIRLTLLLDCGSAVAATMVAVGCALLFGSFLGWPENAVSHGAAYCASVLFMVTATPTGILRLYDRFDLLAIQTSVGSLVRLAGSAVVFLMGGGLAEFLLVWFAASVAAFISLYAAGWRELSRRGHRATTSIGWRGLTRPFDGFWRFVWSTNLNSTVNVGFTHLGTLLTGALLGPAEAGLFRIARQIANALAKPARSLVQVIYPEFARLVAAGEMARLRELLMKLLGLTGAASVLCITILVLAGPPILQLIGGDPARDAYPVLLWLGAAALLEFLAVPLEPALVSAGRPGAALTVRIVAVLVFVPLLVVSIDRLGLVGAGVATLLAALVMLLGQLAYVLRLPVRAQP